MVDVKSFWRIFAKFCSLFGKTFCRNFAKFFCSTGGAFLLGALIGALFFAAQFGFALVNPTNTNWIFYGATHDTAQHFLGWEFFRADGAGATIGGLAYPVGLPLTFMDSIPLLALPLKLFANILPANFQYFGAWALICYVLLGGFAAILMRKIWRKIFAKKAAKSCWQILFVAAGALIFVVNPVTLARTLYHPALAAEWLILLAILLIWDARKFAKKVGKFILVWSALLVAATLIHPYFLPMLGALMLIAALRNFAKFSSQNLAKFLMQIIIPIAAVGATFGVIGGFSLGSDAADVFDLPDKGFNLISFLMSGGWSAIFPAIPARSGSPETMMWLGLGGWILAIFVAIFGVKMLRKKYENSYAKSGFAKYLWREFRAKFRRNFARNFAIALVGFCLLIFAIGVSLEIGPWRIFQWQPPRVLYDFWNVFRAAAREAWAFYFAAILLIIYLAAKIMARKFGVKNAPKICAIIILIVAVAQFCDIFFSPMATTRRANFAKIQNAATREFIAPDIRDLVARQKHLVELDAGFRGDQSGFYELAQSALANNLTLNIGYFARVPAQIFAEQTAWRDKISAGKLTAQDLRDNLFATRDAEFANEISRNYNVEKRGNFYFITQK